MKRYYKLIALIMALILLTGTFAGCKLPTQEPQTITILSEETAQPDVPVETPEPSPAFQVSEAMTEALDTLDLDVFRWYATLDGYSFHMLIDDPDKFGIDPNSVVMTLGEFTEEDSVRITQEAVVYFDRIKAIDREQLPEEKQFSYDVLYDILEDLAYDASEYEYLYEPLTEYSGAHSNLPLSFALFELKNKQDVEDYLTLLADMPRYMGQILAYEQERADRGIFMTEHALDAILDDCSAIIDSRDNSFLYATFNDGIDLLTELTPEEAQAYKDRNASLLKNEYIDSYQTLYDGLKALRKECRSYEEAAEYTDLQKRYFEFSMQDDACNSLTVEETLEMLKHEINYLLYDIIDIETKNPDMFNAEVNLTSGDMQADLDYLKSVIAPILPELPEHNLTLTDVPEELQDQFAPAAYVIPALDDWAENIIYINTASVDTTLLLTLAHEGYPGHLYQYVYQRSLGNVGLTQSAMHFGGYAEGWAQFAEYLITQNQTLYDQDYVRFQFEYSMLVNSLLPALISIMVNYYSYSQEALVSYLTGIGLNGEGIAPVYYEIVVDQPMYFFDYAIGYSQLAQLYREVKDNMGESFVINDFLKTFLDLGPGSFDLVKEQMDIWADQAIQDAA